MQSLNKCTKKNTQLFSLKDKKCFGKIVSIYDADTVTIAIPLISILTIRDNMEYQIVSDIKNFSL